MYGFKSMDVQVLNLYDLKRRNGIQKDLLPDVNYFLYKGQFKYPANTLNIRNI